MSYEWTPEGAKVRQIIKDGEYTMLPERYKPTQTQIDKLDPENLTRMDPDYQPKTREVAVVIRRITQIETILVQVYHDDTSEGIDNFLNENESIIVNRREEVELEEKGRFGTSIDIDIAGLLKKAATTQEKNS